MRRACLFLFAVMCHINMFAVPVLPTSRIVTQKDSCQLEIIMRGDEYCHFYFTIDNIPIAESEDGSFYHVSLLNEEITRTDMLVHNRDERSIEEIIFISTHADEVRQYLSLYWTEQLEKYNKFHLSPANSNPRSRTLGELQTYKGDKKGLVILVNFANRSMSMQNAKEVFDTMFNEIGYNQNGAVGSVHDYFYDQSYGQFNLTFDVIGPVTVSNNYGYYGSNGTSLNGGDINADEMIVEACLLADEEVNYVNYDWDGDGEVEQIFVVYAGYGEASGGPKNTIWPHKSNLEYKETGVLNLDGVIINTYACSCELTGGSGTTLNGIGTACHEFSHCLGLPDLYDTGYSGGFGMSYWDIMSSGSYSGPNGIGEIPTGYSAYEKWFAGWLDIQELNSPCIINNMPCIGDEPVAYALYNDNHRDEYFLLENRQNTKWFSYTGKHEGCHGLLVTHVDYSETAWKNNKVNASPRHQRMTIIPADMSYGNAYSSEGRTYYTLSKNDFQGDLFPGLYGVTELTNTSHITTGGKLFNLNTDGSYYMNKPLTNISENNGHVSFYFMGGIYVPTPEILEASEITNHSFTANWNAVDDADSYTLELSVLKPQGNPIDNILLSENLARFKTGAYSADGYTDLSDNLDNYMQHNGWTGQKVFTSQYGVKIGTTSTTGHLTTPFLNLKSSNLTIRFTAKAVSSAGANIQFILMTSSGSVLELQGCELYYQPNQFVVNFDNVEKNNLKIKITSSERIYLSDIIIYDGFYVASDFDSATGGNHMTGIHSVTVDDIIDNKCLLSELSEKIYKYRVRANKGGAKSGWSNYMEVYLQGDSGLIDTYGGKDSSEYILYNLKGIKIRSLPKQFGLIMLKLHRSTSKKIVTKYD